MKIYIQALALFLFLSVSLPVNGLTPPMVVDGSLIKTADNPDVYIVKLIKNKKFKRLILNPDIFNSYGHLKWENIIQVNQLTMDEYTLSELVIEVNPDGSVADPKVYRVRSAPGSDAGERRWLNITAADFDSLGYDWDSIYNVNHTEASPDFYPTRATLTYSELAAEVLKTVKFTIDADDFGFYIDNKDITSVSLRKGESVEITYNVKSTGVYYGGLDFRGCGQNTATVLPGGSTIVKFQAESNCDIKSYWPSSGVLKDQMTVNIN